jgi:hypothetical protein
MSEEPIPRTILPPIYMFRDVAKNSTRTPIMMIEDPRAVGSRRPHLSPIQFRNIKGITPPMAFEAPKKPSVDPVG